jgi:hypothetical protein
VRMFIGLSVLIYMSIYIYIVFLKKHVIGMLVKHILYTLKNIVPELILVVGQLNINLPKLGLV